MNIDDSIANAYRYVVLGRRSIRGFLPKPVPRTLVCEVIAMAMRAPSSLYTQPWNFTVVSGARSQRLS